MPPASRMIELEDRAILAAWLAALLLLFALAAAPALACKQVRECVVPTDYINGNWNKGRCR